MRGDTERWDVRHQWQRDNQDQHSAHETRHLTSECARSLLASSCCRHPRSLHTTSRGSRLKWSACLHSSHPCMNWALLFDFELSIPSNFLFSLFSFNLPQFLLPFYLHEDTKWHCVLRQEGWGLQTNPTPAQVMSPRTTTSWRRMSGPSQSPRPSNNGSSRMWITTMPQSVWCSSMHTQNKSITPSEKACQLVSRRRSCPKERGNPLMKQVRSWTLNIHRLELFWTDREQILADFQAEIRRHEFQADFDRRSMQKLSETIESQQEELRRAQAEELQRRDPQLHAQLAQPSWELHEAHNISLNEREEQKKFQSSTFDNIARRRLVEDQDIFWNLFGKIQELQNEINCMNDSTEFQDAESVRSGNSHVTSRPVSFPPHPIPEGMLSRSLGMPSRREGPPSIWDTHGISGPASSSALYPQELNPWSSRTEAPIHSSTVEKS